ncbi:MAG TPA: choice-of-anchor P family protein, partial [Chloroflexota bacterium]|nr:choice-of-anchor P family protein [Chloroflexota bacterium]
ARIDSVLPSTIPGVYAPSNARGYAATENLGLLFTVAGAASQPLIGARLIEAEAVARCVGGRAVFDTGSNLAAVTVGGNPVNLDGIINPILNLVTPGGPLAPVVTVIPNETGTLPGGGVFINALRITIPLLNVNIVVSHAEARMPTPCGVAGPPRPGNPGGDVGVGGVDLPRTGSDDRFVLPLSLGLLATAVALRHLNRRARRAQA